MKNIFVIIAILGIVALAVVYRPEKEQQPVLEPVSYDGANTTESSAQQPLSTTNNKKMTTKNGMTIEVIKEGNGPEIKNGQTAVVEYSGALTDGTVFDASARHGQPFSFPLGAGMVIQGWEQGVLGMKVGETRKLTIPSELGYGAAGAGGVIPPNATLIFDVTLTAIK